MTRKLVDSPPGQPLRIVNIDAGRGARLQLMNLGLDVGQEIKLLSKSLLRGPVLVMHGATELAIGHGLAAKILVESS